MLTFAFLLAGCANTEKAEAAADRYAAENYPGYEIVNRSCEGYDSDDNGRVRCNLSLKNPKDGEIITPGIECPSNILPQFASDCQAVKR